MSEVAPLTPETMVFSYDRPTWERLWENSRLSQVEAKVAETRSQVLALLLAGDRDEALALWRGQVPVWESMLLPLREQAEAIRCEQGIAS